MAGSAILEREIARQETFATKEREMSREEREHRNKISANYDIFRYSDNTSWADPAVRAQERYEIPEAFRQAEEETSNRAYAPAQSAPAWKPASNSAATVVRHGGLFEDVNFINGDLVYTRDMEALTMAPEAPAATPAAAPVAAPAPQVAPADRREAVAATAPSDLPATDEDAVPTRRTMDTLIRPMAAMAKPEATEETNLKTGVFASLSLKTKIVLASIAAAIILAIAIVCINTGLINSLDGKISNRRTRAAEEQQTYEKIVEEIESFNDPNNETVRLWAEEHGMTRP